jgi:hypothetical protein
VDARLGEQFEGLSRAVTKLRRLVTFAEEEGPAPTTVFRHPGASEERPG